MENRTESIKEEERNAVVNDLFQKVIDMNDESLLALEKLSGMAMGGDEQARERISQIEELVEEGGLIFTEAVDSRANFKDVLFVATHPILSLRTRLRQVCVAIERGAPPFGSTIEDFPDLTLADAARLMMEEENEFIGVPISAWSKADQRRLAEGKKPKGYPLHPNV